MYLFGSDPRITMPPRGVRTEATGRLVPTIDSSSIGMLVRYLKQSGGSVRLVKPSKFVSQTLKMVGILNLFSSYENLSDAIASLQ